MKTLAKLLMVATVATALVGTSTAANAGVLDKLKKAAKKTVQGVKKGTKKAVQAVKKETKKAVQTVKKETKKAADKVVKAAETVGKKVVEGAKWLGHKIEEIYEAAKTLLKELKEKIGNLFSLTDAIEIVKKLIERYKSAKAALKSGINTVKNKAAALAKQGAAVAKSTFNSLKQRLVAPGAALAKLIKSDGKLIRRVFLKVLKGEFDAALKSDVKTLVEKLGFAKKTKLASLSRRAAVEACSFKDYGEKDWDKTTPKSLFLTLLVSGSVGKIIGVTGALQFGMVLDLGKDDDRAYDIRGYFSVGIGGTVGVVGASGWGGVVLGISPLKTRDASGPFVGASFDFATPKFVGGMVAVDWSINFFDGKMTPMPTISIGVGAGKPGVGLSAAGGFGFTFTKDAFCAGFNEPAACK